MLLLLGAPAEELEWGSWGRAGLGRLFLETSSAVSLALLASEADGSPEG